MPFILCLCLSGVHPWPLNAFKEEHFVTFNDSARLKCNYWDRAAHPSPNKHSQDRKKKSQDALPLARTTHQTWPDIREEVLQGAGRASLIPHWRWLFECRKRVKTQQPKLLFQLNPTENNRESFWSLKQQNKQQDLDIKANKTIASSWFVIIFVGSLPLSISTCGKCCDMQSAHRNATMSFRDLCNFCWLKAYHIKSKLQSVFTKVEDMQGAVCSRHSGPRGSHCLMYNLKCSEFSLPKG